MIAIAFEAGTVLHAKVIHFQSNLNQHLTKLKSKYEWKYALRTKEDSYGDWVHPTRKAKVTSPHRIENDCKHGAITIDQDILIINVFITIYFLNGNVTRERTIVIRDINVELDELCSRGRHSIRRYHRISRKKEINKILHIEYIFTRGKERAPEASKSSANLPLRRARK